MLNIRNGRVFGIAQVVREVELGGFDFMVLTETKISTAAYFHNRMVYNIVCSPSPTASSGGAQVGVVLVSCDLLTGWSLE